MQHRVVGTTMPAVEFRLDHDETAGGGGKAAEAGVVGGIVGSLLDGIR